MPSSQNGDLEQVSRPDAPHHRVTQPVGVTAVAGEVLPPGAPAAGEVALSLGEPCGPRIDAGRALTHGLPAAGEARHGEALLAVNIHGPRRCDDASRPPRRRDAPHLGERGWIERDRQIRAFDGDPELVSFQGHPLERHGKATRADLAREIRRGLHRPGPGVERAHDVGKARLGGVVDLHRRIRERGRHVERRAVGGEQEPLNRVADVLERGRDSGLGGVDHRDVALLRDRIRRIGRAARVPRPEARDVQRAPVRREGHGPRIGACRDPRAHRALAQIHHDHGALGGESHIGCLSVGRDDDIRRLVSNPDGVLDPPALDADEAERVTPALGDDRVRHPLGPGDRHRPRADADVPELLQGRSVEPGHGRRKDIRRPYLPVDLGDRAPGMVVDIVKGRRLGRDHLQRRGLLTELEEVFPGQMRREARHSIRARDDDIGVACRRRGDLPGQRGATFYRSGHGQIEGLSSDEPGPRLGREAGADAARRRGRRKLFGAAAHGDGSDRRGSKENQGKRGGERAGAEHGASWVRGTGLLTVNKPCTTSRTNCDGVVLRAAAWNGPRLPAGL